MEIKFRRAIPAILANLPAAEFRADEENAGLLHTAANNRPNKNEQKLFNNQDG